MNSLLPPGNSSTKVQKVRAREFPISAVRFVQEMGDGAFGKVYRGELGGIVGGMTSLVAVKTLKPGANSATRSDFQRESEMMADLRHPNIVCLLGVVTKDEPQCLIFEWMPQGDLHEYLLSHSPKSDLAFSLSGSCDGETERILDHGDMSYIAIQISSGMEYLAQHQYIHRYLYSLSLSLALHNISLSFKKSLQDQKVEMFVFSGISPHAIVLSDRTWW